MNKILLALCILGTGAGSFHAARQATTQVHNEADATRAAWLAETQLALAAETQQAELAERVREQESVLNQPQAVGESAFWSALQTNRGDHLAPELREHFFDEVGLSWTSSEEYILVSKETLREVRLAAIRADKLSDIAAIVLAITPAERTQVEAAMQQVHADFRDWASSHVERTEPKGDMVAQYTLPADPAMTVSNNFAVALFAAVGRQRAQMILGSDSCWNWLVDLGVTQLPETMVITRYLAGTEQRFGIQSFRLFGTPGQSGDRRPIDVLKHEFPAAFLPVFPNGWADVAKREGFELPPAESQEK